LTICDAKQTARLFMNMTNKTKHLRVRLTEEMFNRLAEALIIKQKTKSSLVRDAISDYMDRTNNGIDKQNQENNKNKKTLL
jgi:metal-responsive CopG/Arc/MetJ family transcriptional regulator